MKDIALPVKPREFKNRFFDATVWNGLKYRDNDIVIASYAKAGTTLVQQIVAQLIFSGAEDIHVSRLSPWLDSVHPDKETKLNLVESQTHRRFLKTHLPADALPFSATAKYIYVGRDGRDIVWSLYDHQLAIRQESRELLDADNSGRLRVIEPPASSILDYFNAWLDKDGYPFWPFWENVSSWWAMRHLPNVRVVHFANLLGNLPEEIRRIAQFIGTPIDESTWETILRHCGFAHMQANADKYVPQQAGIWKEKGKAFFNKGQNGRWRGGLPPDLSAKFEQRALDELGSACAHWLATGELR